MLSCRTVVSYLDDHEDVGGWASHLVPTGVRLHLKFCADCDRYVAQIKAMAAALGGIATEGVSAPTKARLMERFRAWRTNVDAVDNVDNVANVDRVNGKDA